METIFNKIKSIFSLRISAVILLINIVLLWRLHPIHINPDGVGYFVYLPTLLLKKTLWFGNIFESADFLMPAVLTPTNLIGNSFPCGTAMLWFPTFLTVNLGWNFFLSSFSNSLLPYQYATNWATMIYGTAAMFFVYDILKKYYAKNSLWISLAVFFGTPLFFYTLSDLNMSHAPSAFMVTLFLWIWTKTEIGSSSLSRWALLGIAGGIIAMVRMQDIAYLSVFACDYYIFLKKKDYRQIIFTSLIFISFFCLGFFPQFYIWKKTYGSYFANPQISLLSWQIPRIHQILFSPYHGLFWWTPISLIGIGGLIAASFKNDPDLFSIGMLLGILLELVIMSLDPVWSQARSFGIRRLTSSVLPIAWGVGWVGSNMKSKIHWWIIGICTLWTVTLAIADSYSIINLTSYFSISELFKAQFLTLSRFNILDFLKIPESIRLMPAQLLLLLALSEVAIIGFIVVLVSFIKSARYLIALFILIMPISFFSILAWRSQKLSPASFSPDTSNLAIISAGEFKNHVDLLNDNILHHYHRKQGNLKKADYYLTKMLENSAHDRISQRLKDDAQEYAQNWGRAR